jgi:hypothetical protein
MYFKILVSSPENSASLDGIWGLSASSPLKSLNNIINYFTALSTKVRSAYLTTFLNPIPATMTVTFNGTPANFQSITIGKTPLIAVTGTPTGPQFAVGATPADTANNFVNTIRTQATAFPVFRASNIGPVVTLTAQEPGSAGNGLSVVNNLSNVVATTFVGGDDGSVKSLPCGFTSAVPNGTMSEFLIQTDLTEGQLDAILNIRPTAVHESLNNILNYFASLLSGNRSALIICRRGLLPTSYALIFTGQPAIAQTVTVNRQAFTTIASGAVAPQFNIGPTVPDTASNLTAAINTTVSQNKVYQIMNATLSGSIVFITALSPGGLSSGYIVGETLSNATLTQSVNGSNGVQTDLVFAYDSTQTLPRLGE